MFELKPLLGYEKPRYGQGLVSWGAWLLPRGAVRLAALLLVAGLGLGSCDNGENDACQTEGFFGCVEEGATMALFCADGKVLEKSCIDVCRAKSQGYVEGFCHAQINPKEPCDCRYASVDGDIGDYY